MTSVDAPASRRRALVWWASSLGLATVLGLALTWGVGAFDRLGALPAPQAPAWYDCEGANPPYALQYLPGSDRIALQWSDGSRLQGESFPDRITWQLPAGLGSERLAALPRSLRYESAQRLELLSAAQATVLCQRRQAAPQPSAP